MRFRTITSATVLALALSVGFSHTAWAEELSAEQAVEASTSAVAIQGAQAASAPEGSMYLFLRRGARKLLR